jgi:alpha-galactosidase/6-phospho-beta-glucosidase family protein
MTEVKNMAGIMGQSKREIMEYFKSYIEDYNTATMPHEKYYNYERWEMENYRREQAEKASKRHVERDTFNDEEERRAEKKLNKALEEKKEVNGFECAFYCL